MNYDDISESWPFFLHSVHFFSFVSIVFCLFSGVQNVSRYLADVIYGGGLLIHGLAMVFHL